MKKLINSPETVVTDALEGVAAAHPSLSVDVENKVITRAGGPTPGKVGLVSGGGSGHEPLHGGFVGYGMLDAACPGEVFTSPVPDQMLLATQAVNGGAGVLHIVKNYTGDVLNFQMAAEMAEDDGIEVVPVVINDDVAVQDSLYTAGRRGTGATVLVEKIAGALAEEGTDLAAVAAVPTPTQPSAVLFRPRPGPIHRGHPGNRRPLSRVPHHLRELDRIKWIVRGGVQIWRRSSTRGLSLGRSRAYRLRCRPPYRPRKTVDSRSRLIRRSRPRPGPGLAPAKCSR